MIGAVVFAISFVLSTLVSLAVGLPPGIYVHGWFNVPASEYSSLINGVVNGVVYGVIVWLAFSLVKMALHARVMEMKVKNDWFYVLDAPDETWIYDSEDGAIEASKTLDSKKELNPEDVNIFEVNVALARDTWLSRVKKARSNAWGAGPVKEIVAAEAEMEELRRRVWSYRRLPTRLAGYMVTFAGAAALAGSMIFSSSVWAMIGLALTFWGVLFFFLKPTSLVKADLLDSASYSLLENVYRLVSEFGLKGKGVYLPPRYLKDLSSGMVFIPAEDEVYVPTVDEVGEAEERVFLKNPSGVCLVPSGVALVNLFERELGTSFAKVDLEYLMRNLPKVFVEALEIAEDFELCVEGGRVHVRIEGFIYKDLCGEVRRLSRVCEVFGCLLCSSIACALARASGKPVVMDGNELSRDGKVMDVYYRVLEE